MTMKTINITLKIEDHELTNFESWLRQQLEVIDLRVIPNTSKLYETDKTFQRLVKLEKQARTEKLNYINEHNVN